MLLYSGFENGDVYIWKNIDSGQRSTKVVESVHCPVQAIFCDPEGMYFISEDLFMRSALSRIIKYYGIELYRLIANELSLNLGTTSSKVLKGEIRNTESLIVVYRDLVKFVRYRYTSESGNKRSEWLLEVPRKPCEK